MPSPHRPAPLQGPSFLQGSSAGPSQNTGTGPHAYNNQHPLPPVRALPARTSSDAASASDSDSSDLHALASTGSSSLSIPTVDTRATSVPDILPEAALAGLKSVDTAAAPPYDLAEASDSEIESLIPHTLLTKLKTFPLFKDAPKLFHTKVAAKLKLVPYHPQAYIIKEGDPALSMFWILKGTVSVTSTDGESVYAHLSAGAFFGEIGILFNRPRTATVVACQRVLVGVLTADALNLVLKLYPVIERRIRDEAQERLAMQEKKNKADIPIIKLSKSPAPPALGVSMHLVPHGPSQIAPLPLSQIAHVSQHSALGETHADNVDSTVSIQSFIKSVPIFRNLPSHIIHKVALGVEPQSFKPFEYIFRKGHSGTEIFFITHGEVEVIDMVNGVEKTLARLQTGSYFGEMSFLEFIQGATHVARSASIRSVSLVELIVIRTDQLEDVCHQYPNVVDEMRHTANERKLSNDNYDSCSQSTSLSKMPMRLPLSNGMMSFSSSSIVTNPFALNSADSSSSSTAQSSPNIDHFPSTTGLFNPNWNFGGPGSDARDAVRKLHSRSVSPVSSMEPDSRINKQKTLLDEAVTLNSRKSLSAPDSVNQLPEGPLSMSVPPLNPAATPKVFPQVQAMKSQFQYMPHNKRIKLSNLAGRRRSSVLISTGTIPDKVLLGAFEFLTLPELMRLRLVSRRWRQLLYIVPTLCQNLDITPWNTTIDDQALVHITDFVGSRPKFIDISNCFHVTDEGFSYLVNEIGMAGHITKFKMRCLWEVSAMAIMDLTSPSVGKHLEEVDLLNCRKVTDAVVERLIGWSSESNGQGANTEGKFNNEVGSKNLRILNLSYCKHLTDNIMYHISLHANERLESLDLTRCTTITDAGFQHWTYRSFPNLKKLTLKDCTFLSDKSIISLANAAPNLEILNLNFCRALLDLAIEILCLGCQNLRELDLSFCGSAVSDSTLVAISLHLCNLEKLILKGCVRVTRAGVDALISGYSPISYIDISQCRNAHCYPGRIPAPVFRVNPSTRSAFITAGSAQKIIEMVI